MAGEKRSHASFSVPLILFAALAGGLLTLGPLPEGKRWRRECFSNSAWAQSNPANQPGTVANQVITSQVNSGPAVGFAVADRNPLYAIEKLAMPGPNRGARAVELLDRFLPLQRRISFHPTLDPGLQKAIENLPPRQSTLIRAAELYSRTDIPWRKKPPAVHFLSVAGRPQGNDYLYRLTENYMSPEAAGDFAGLFALRPPNQPQPGKVNSVIGELGGELYPGVFGLGEVVDVGTELLRATYGDLAPPWDATPGVFNHHDQASLARFARDLPTLAACVNHYLQFDNVLDEMMVNNVATVLFNIDAHVREGALKPFPKLEHFYKSISSQVEADSVLQDSSGHRWMHTSFDQGRIRVQFMIQHGMLTPMNEALAPAGAPIDLSKIQSGSFVAHQWAKVHRLGMTFGLENVTLVTEFRRNATGARFSNHMSTIPQVIAPPIVNQVMMLLAGEFMRRLATGNGGQGVAGNFASKEDPRGGSLFSGGISAEFYYSPGLEFLAKVGDAIASAHNEEVREEERRLGEELFNAFVTDYYRARPALIAMMH